MAYITNLPVNGRFNVTAYFGQQNTSLWANGHKGIDITGDKTLYSVCEGTVTYVGYDKNGWGQYVSVKPDGYDRIRFILCHMAKGSQKVRKGDHVGRKTVLGTMGATGNVTGVHVHVECRIDNTAVDPTPYLGISNAKASGLMSIDYITTPEESNEVLASMLRNFDGVTIVTPEPGIDYKELWQNEKKAREELDLRVSALSAKIEAAKAALN